MLQKGQKSSIARVAKIPASLNSSSGVEVLEEHRIVAVELYFFAQRLVRCLREAVQARLLFVCSNMRSRYDELAKQ